MKALLCQGPREISFPDVPVPEIGPGEVLLSIEACGLSDSDILDMGAARNGHPVALGREVAGRIAALGPGVRKFKKGDRVIVSRNVACHDCHYCRRGEEPLCRSFKQSRLDPGGFSEFVRLSAMHVEHAMLAIPAKMGYPSAAMADPLACSLRGVKRMGLGEGDCALVLGLGFTGLLTSQLLVRQGVTAVGVDLDPARIRLAQKLGVEHAYTGKDGRVEQIISSLTETRGADGLAFTLGTPELLMERLTCLRDGGVVNIFADFPASAIARIDLNMIHHRGLTLTASAWAAGSDLRDALSMIAKGEIDVSRYVQDTFPLEEFAEALRQVRGQEIVKAVLVPH